MKLCEFDWKSQFSLLYRASVDGFAASSFHSKCDNKGKTLTIVKAKNKSNIDLCPCSNKYENTSDKL